MIRKNTTKELMKTYISKSLLILMKEKAYSKITINEITAKAGVNRSTYYRNFQSKEEIIRFYISNIMKDYIKEFDESEDKSNENYMSIIFNNFYKHKNELLLIHKNKMSYLMLDELNEYFELLKGINLSIGEKYKMYFHTGGIYNFLNLWLINGMKESPKILVKLSLEYLGKQSKPTLIL